jgi:hypothetical protein
VDPRAGLDDAKKSIWKDNIKIDPKQNVVWIDLAQDKDQWRLLVNTVMNPEFLIILGIA